MNTRVGNLSLLQQIFLTQELNQGLLHRRWILYHACMLSCFSHVQLFVILWAVAYQASLSIGFSGQESWGSSQPRVSYVSYIGRQVLYY